MDTEGDWCPLNWMGVSLRSQCNLCIKKIKHFHQKGKQDSSLKLHITTQLCHVGLEYHLLVGFCLIALSNGHTGGFDQTGNIYFLIYNTML